MIAFATISAVWQSQSAIVALSLSLSFLIESHLFMQMRFHWLKCAYICMSNKNKNLFAISSMIILSRERFWQSCLLSCSSLCECVCVYVFFYMCADVCSRLQFPEFTFHYCDMFLNLLTPVPLNSLIIQSLISPCSDCRQTRFVPQI